MRHLVAFAALIATAAPACAGFIHVVALREIESAPVLVVATIESVSRKEPAPNQPREADFFDAILRVHRAYPRNSLPPTLTLRYVSYAPLTGGVSGSPLWPMFERGQTLVFPLKPGQSGKWRLAVEEGLNQVVPAIVRPPAARAATTGREFILNELANTLAAGDAVARYAAAAYLSQPGAEPAEFRSFAERALGTDEDRWLEAACALLASVGIPRVPIAQLLVAPNAPGYRDGLAAWALAKGAKRDFPHRLIRCLLRNMPSYDWGAANSLLEFKDSPLVVETLRRTLASEPAGSIYTAWILVRNGQRVFLEEALAAAVTLVSAPEKVAISRLQAASSLLGESGSDAQFDAIPVALRRLKFRDEAAYRKLASSVYLPGPRQLRVAAAMIDDCRSGYGKIRYCDTAAATVGRLADEKFEVDWQAPQAKRDRAVARAAAWLAQHGY